MHQKNLNDIIISTQDLSAALAPLRLKSIHQPHAQKRFPEFRRRNGPKSRPILFLTLRKHALNRQTGIAAKSSPRTVAGKKGQAAGFMKVPITLDADFSIARGTVTVIRAGSKRSWPEPLRIAGRQSSPSAHRAG